MGPASSSYESARAKLADSWRDGAIGLKASFALIGVVNTVVDYSVFLLAHAARHRATAWANYPSAVEVLLSRN